MVSARDIIEAEDPKTFLQRTAPRPEGVSLKDISIDDRPDVEDPMMRYTAMWTTPFMIAHRSQIRGCPAGTGQSQWAAIRELVDITNKESKTKFFFNFQGGYTAPAQESEDPKAFIQHQAPRQIVVHCYMGKWLVDARTAHVKKWIPDSNADDDPNFASWAANRSAFDFNEWEQYWKRRVDAEQAIDICDVGSWDFDGKYDPPEEDYRQEEAERRANDVNEAEDPKAFLQRHAPREFEVHSTFQSWLVDEKGKVVAAYVEPGRRGAARPSRFNVEEYRKRTGQPPTGVISLQQISYWNRKGNYFICGPELYGVTRPPRQ